MDIHEYQAKELLAGFGVAVPRGGVAYSPEQAVYRAAEIGGNRWAVKAQIHSGARGKAGGVKLCSTEDEVRQAAKALLGKRLVTHQTGPRGARGPPPLHRAGGADRARALPRPRARPEERAHHGGGLAAGRHGDRGDRPVDSPNTILREVVEPAVGMHGVPGARARLRARPRAGTGEPRGDDAARRYRAFRDLDATMVEINPLVVTEDGSLLALDAKMTFDDNALFRRPNVAELRDYAEEDPARGRRRPSTASTTSRSTGNIGCIINGAGLAMATMDMIKHAGGEPANFLDIGGGASPERVAAAFRLVLSDPKVEAILVNIFAGINRCDWVAQGVVQAAQGDAAEDAAGGAAGRHQRRGGPEDPQGQRPADHHRRHAGRGGRAGRDGHERCEGSHCGGEDLKP